MRKFIGLGILFSLFNSCQKVPVDYLLIKPTLGSRKVVVEEFTGANCPNCPKGTEQLKNLMSLYDENLIQISIHAGSFARKINNSKYDFLTSEGTTIMNFVTPPEGYPSAVINRKKFSNETSLQLFLPVWAGYIESESNILPKVEIKLNKEYNSITRQGNITVQITPIEDIKFATNISIFVIENKIIDPQKDNRIPSGTIEDYEHNHIFRYALTNPTGDPLPASMKKDEKQFIAKTFSIPTQNGWWNDENIEIVAFMSSSIGASHNIEILQAEKIAIKN